MNNKMWSNKATQSNLATLMQRGAFVLGPASGDQACGEQGEGRLLEPMSIITELAQLMMPAQLQGKTVVITAGPTYEPIDPVRFIGNRSSGKMGFAVAKAAREAGATVILIAGPVHLATPAGVERINVETAAQMHQKVMANIAMADIFIACAAVADFSPNEVADNKIKKTETGQLHIELMPTADIVSDVANLTSPPFIVGFAAETQSVEMYAQTKLANKKMDMIAANQVGAGIGFAVDDNALNVFWAEGSQELPLATKTKLARDLMTLIIERFYAKNSTQTT